MPDDPKTETSATVKWLIGGVAVGIAAIGAWVGAALNNSQARDDKIREYLQQEVDKGRQERGDLSKAINNMADSSRELTTAVKSQTQLLSSKFDTLISDTRKGVWREADKPEQP